MRSDSHSGFIFLNNYQKDHPLPVQKAVAGAAEAGLGDAMVPRRPVDIPSGAYTFWPVNLPMGATVLAEATAQPLCRLETNTLQTNSNSLQVALENVTSSESSIADTNFASETSNLTRDQILQQAGTSVLATANSISQNVLTLLQGK